MYRLLGLVLAVLLLPHSVKSARKNALQNPSKGQIEPLLQQLEQQAFSAEPGSLQAKKIWNEVSVAAALYDIKLKQNILSFSFHLT